MWQPGSIHELRQALPELQQSGGRRDVPPQQRWSKDAGASSGVLFGRERNTTRPVHEWCVPVHVVRAAECPYATCLLRAESKPRLDNADTWLSLKEQLKLVGF